MFMISLVPFCVYDIVATIDVAGMADTIDVVDIDARNTKAKINAFIFTPFLLFKEDGAEKYTILGIAVNAI